jgi:RecJ-like exonuclease
MNTNITTVLECSTCHKSKSSKALGMYNVSLVRIDNVANLAISCKNCRTLSFLPIQYVFGTTLIGTGRILCCNHNLYKIHTTRERIVLICYNCRERQYFNKVII